ncbi:MAG: hypothetical protein ACRDQ0_13255, partial [Pseudonocardia sp.]
INEGLGSEFGDLPSTGRFRVSYRDRTLSASERRMPESFDGGWQTWHRHTPAQRAEAWQEEADSERRVVEQLEQRRAELQEGIERLDAEINELRERIDALQQRADELRALGESRGRGSLSARVVDLMAWVRARFSGAEWMSTRRWREETGRVGAELAAATDRHDQAVVDHAERVWALDQIERAIAEHARRAEVCEAYAAVHRDVAGRTRLGRKDLRVIEELRAAGQSSWRVERHASRLRAIHWLAVRGLPGKLVAQLLELEGRWAAEDAAGYHGSGRPRIFDLLAVGLADDEAVLGYLERFSVKYDLGWTDDERAALLAALPRTMRALTGAERLATSKVGLPHRQRRQSLRRALVVLAGGGAGLWIMMPAGWAMAVGWPLLIGLAVVGLLRAAVHIVRVRGPPAMWITLVGGQAIVVALWLVTALPVLPAAAGVWIGAVVIGRLLPASATVGISREGGFAQGGGPSRRGEGDFTGAQVAKLARRLATQFRLGITSVIPVAVRDEHGVFVGWLRLLPVQGLTEWVARTLGITDLVAFAWVGSGERLVAVDTELTGRIQRIHEVIEAARESGHHEFADELQRRLDAWTLELFRHENVHFDHPDAGHDDHVFDGHREVRHHLLVEAEAFAEYVHREITFDATSRSLT